MSDNSCDPFLASVPSQSNDASHIHSMFTDVDTLTAHEAELYPTAYGQSFPHPLFLPTSSIKSLNSAGIQRRYSIIQLATSMCTQQYVTPGSIVSPQVLEDQLSEEFCVNPADISVSSDVAAGWDSLNPSSPRRSGAQSIMTEPPNPRGISRHAELVHVNHGRGISTQQYDVAKPGTRNRLAARALSSSRSSAVSAGGLSSTQRGIRKRPLKTAYLESTTIPSPQNGALRHACEWHGCTSSFTRRRDRYRHLQSCHLQSKESCSQCGKSLSRADSVKRHLDKCKA